jgi:hypothetical protein
VALGQWPEAIPNMTGRHSDYHLRRRYAEKSRAEKRFSRSLPQEVPGLLIAPGSQIVQQYCGSTDTASRLSAWVAVTALIYG